MGYEVTPNGFVSDGYSLHIQFNMVKSCDKEEKDVVGAAAPAMADPPMESLDEPLSSVGVDPGNVSVVVAARGSSWFCLLISPTFLSHFPHPPPIRPCPTHFFSEMGNAVQDLVQLVKSHKILNNGWKSVWNRTCPEGNWSTLKEADPEARSSYTKQGSSLAFFTYWPLSPAFQPTRLDVTAFASGARSSASLITST